MKRVTTLILAVVVLSAAASLTEATSSPVIDVAISGIELCPQSVCGAADFTGTFKGRIGNHAAATGKFQVAITHDPLPAPNNTANITGGTWSLMNGTQQFSGVASDGTLFNNGDNTFAVYVHFVLRKGGTGNLYFHGTLNHNTVIPTVTGNLNQTGK